MRGYWVIGQLWWQAKNFKILSDVRDVGADAPYKLEKFSVIPACKNKFKACREAL